MGLEKVSVARKLTSLRSFFKFCHREGMIQKNPARLVSTPKLPKRVPVVMPAEELNLFLDQIGKPASPPDPDTILEMTIARTSGEGRRAKAPAGSRADESRLMLRRDRAIFELLYASGLRVSELTALDLGDVDRTQLILHIRRGKGRKERIMPFGSKALAALGCLRAATQRALAQGRSARRTAGSVSELCGWPPYQPKRGPCGEEVRTFGAAELGLASALAAPRVRHAPAR